MIIKLALLEKDNNYLQRIVSVFSTKYSDKIEIYSFTDEKVAIKTIADAGIDVLIASDKFEINVQELPKKCSFAYFVESPSIDTVNDQRAICKFQKADLLYKQILDVYSENLSRISELNFTGSSTKTITFLSPSGGAGSSSLAAACAMYFARQGEKTLYLNLEKFSSTDAFYSAPGQFDMSDVIFALKSKKSNIILKLESCVRQDNSGVYFYAPPKIALDLMELNVEEIEVLVKKLQQSGSYKYIIIDSDFEINKNRLDFYRLSHALVFTGDGSDVSNGKILAAIKAIKVLDRKADIPLTDRLEIIYNKFSNKSCKIIDEISSLMVGGAPRFENVNSKGVVQQLSKLDMYKNILEYK